MRGTSYAVFEIILWMLLAGLIGVAIGWILRGVFGGSQRVADLEKELESEKGRYAKLSESLAAKKHELEASLRDVDAAQADVTRTRESAAALEEELMKVRADLAKVHQDDGADGAPAGSEAAAASDIERLSSRVRELEAELASVTTARDEMAVAHAGCAVDADETAGVIAAKEAEIGRLSDEVAGFAGLQSATQDKLAELADAEERLEEAATRLGAAAAERDAARAALEECRSASERASRRVEELERSLAQQTAFEVEAASWQQGTTSLGTPGAAHRDDLKVINGVGPALEELLNSFGIRSWEQLAALTESEVATVDAALEEFPGRIHRDEWVGQARDLVKRFPDVATRPDRDTYLNEAPRD